MVHNRFMHWLLAHTRALRLACVEFVHAPITNFITTCVISIAIILPLCFYVMLENLQRIDSNSGMTTPTISLYLKSPTMQPDVDALLKSLRENPAIQKMTYISPEEGLAEFEKNTPFSNIAKLFQQNPIPGVIILFPNEHNRTPAALNTLFDTLKVLPFVDVAQLDINWITRLYDIILIGQKVVSMLSILFAAGIMLIIGHTLRAQLIHHLKEIQLLRLIGAPNAFIRRPLLYRGVLYGLLGGSLAWASIVTLTFQLQSPISQLAKSYQSTFQLTSLTLLQGIGLLVIAGMLGLFSAWVIASQFLNLPEQVD